DAPHLVPRRTEGGGVVTLAIARAWYGACPRCPQPTWHDGPCPLWAAAEERDHPVPCQTRCGRHTWRNDALCGRCAALPLGRARVGGGVAAHPTPLSPADRAARNAATAEAVERLIEATVPGTGATASTGPGSFPRVLR